MVTATWRDDTKFVIGVAITALLLVAAVMFTWPSADTDFRNAVVMRICVDGTYIVRLPNGEYRTGGFSRSRVDNPETVCTAR